MTEAARLEEGPFDRALEFVLRWEGGGKITRDPDDPGGVTRWGISKRAHPELDIARLTYEQAREVYRRRYWDACRCEDRPPADALVMFDTAVNTGVSRALRWAKRADGAGHFIDELLVRRCLHYGSLGIFARYGKGWLRRVMAVHRLALEMEGR